MKNIIEKIYRKKDIDKIKEKINMLGHVKYDEFLFIQNRLITTILITLIFVFLTFFGNDFINLISSSDNSPLLSIIDISADFISYSIISLFTNESIDLFT